MKRQLIKLAAVGSIAAGMIFAQAQTAPPSAGQNNQAQAGHAMRGVNGMHNRRGAARRREMAALNLTPEQKTMAKSIFAQAREQSKPVRMEMRQNREALAAAVKANDKPQIDRLSAERGRLAAKLSASRGEAMAKFYQTLTPAQRAKADAMHARAQARMREMREHRGTRTNG
jgi:Spy/CpxP family protein refolding chaperone